MNGTSIARFRITGELGERGVGTAHRAVDSKLEREARLLTRPGRPSIAHAAREGSGADRALVTPTPATATPPTTSCHTARSRTGATTEGTK